MNLTTALTPGSLTVSNAAKDYTFTGNGGIGGAIALNKVGTGELTLATSNTFTGGVMLSGGVVNVNATETAGSSGPLGQSGTISFNGGTLQYNTNNVFDYSARFSTAASQAYSIDTAGQTVTLASPLTSSGGTLTKAGAGTLNLSAVNTYSGMTTISGGSLIISGAGQLNSATVMTNNGNFTYASSAAQTLSGPFLVAAR